MPSIQKQFKIIDEILHQSKQIVKKYDELDTSCRKLNDMGKENLINADFKTDILSKLPIIVIPSTLSPILNKYHKQKDKIWKEKYNSFRMNIEDRSELKRNFNYVQGTEYQLPKAEIEFQLEIAEYPKKNYWTVKLDGLECEKIERFGFDRTKCEQDIRDNFTFLKEIMTDKQKLINVLDKMIIQNKKEKDEYDQLKD